MDKGEIVKTTTLKKMIDLLNSIKPSSDEECNYLRIENCTAGLRLYTHSRSSVCNVFIPNEICSDKDRMIHRDELEFLKAIYKQDKKLDDVQDMGTFLNYTLLIRKPTLKVDDTLGECISSEELGSVTVNFKLLERVYKGMKRGTDNIKISIRDKSPLLVYNEEGDVSVISLVD